MNSDFSTPSVVPGVKPSVSYFEATRTATYSFLISLPLLAAYEVLIAFVNRGQLQQIRVGAEVWVKQLVALVGGTGVPVLAIVVGVIGFAVLIVERKRRPPLVARYFGWMLLESVVYALVLALLVGATVGALFAVAPAGPQLQDEPFLMQVALSLGAGLYEELVFRVLLVGGLFWVTKRLIVRPDAGSGVTSQRVLAYSIAAIVGALLFSFVHYTGSLGDTFTLSSFTFRFLFGLALNVVFLLRGFGIAAWSHALYDISIALGVWS